MRKNLITIFLAIGLIFLFAPTESIAAKCKGYSNCKACKNCKYCKRCSKEGGSCGVCSTKKKKVNNNKVVAESGEVKRKHVESLVQIKMEELNYQYHIELVAFR